VAHESEHAHALAPVTVVDVLPVRRPMIWHRPRDNNASRHGTKWLTGGSTGPDGNAVTVALFCVGIVLLAIVCRRVRYDSR
jgi:hypothetical protein